MIMSNEVLCGMGGMSGRKGLIKRIIGQQRGKHGWKGLQRYLLGNHRG